MTKTTSDMTNFETGAVRDTGGKGRMDLLPMCALIRVSKHMEDANAHYPERNWEKGMPIHCMIDSALRHLVKYVDGQQDEDHLCAAATNLLMAMWTEEKKPEMQDIPTRMKKKIDKTSKSQTCDCWINSRGEGYCSSTRELDACSCNGDTHKCDFYPDKRKL